MGRGDESSNIMGPTNLALVFFLISICILSSVTNHNSTQLQKYLKTLNIYTFNVDKKSIFSLIFMIKLLIFMLNMVSLILQKLKYYSLKGEVNTHERIELEHNFECSFT